MKRGGFDVFTGLVDDNLRAALLAEAIERYPYSTICEVDIPDDEEVRGGRPRRRFSNSEGGPVQQAFVAARWVLDFLRSLTTKNLFPTGAVGTYSYYIRPGDYLDIHRDIVTCDVAVITCLHDRSAGETESGRLCLYPERLFDRISAVRATRDEGAVKVRVDVGQTIVLYGGLVPHTLLPVAENQERIVSVLCYQAG